MKKLLLSLLVILSITSFTSEHKKECGQPYGFFNAGIAYDSDAKKYIDSIGDLPYSNKFAINKLVKYLKANSLWTKIKYLIISPVTISETNAYRDLITNTVLAVIQPPGGNNDQRNAVSAYPIGYLANNNNAQYIKSGAILSNLGVSVTSTCFFWGEKREVTSSAHAYGCIVSASSRSYARIVSTGLGYQLFKDFYTDATVRATPGRWFQNRNAANYVEIVKNNSIVQSSSTTESGSTITNIENFIFTSNTAGSPTGGIFSDGIKDYWGISLGLSISDRSLLDAGMNQFRTDMKRPGDSYTKQVVFSGNSINLRGSSRILRKAMVVYGPSNVGIYNTGISGQTTTLMLANYGTQDSVLYNGSLSKNIYVVQEVGNDLTSGVSVATAKSNLSSLVTRAKNMGYTVVVMVPTARTYVGNTGGRSETQFNLDYDTMVQWIRAGSSGANYVCDLTNPNLWLDRSSYASDALYNTAILGIVSNLTYYASDKVHPVNPGLDIRGVDLGNVLRAIL